MKRVYIEGRRYTAAWEGEDMVHVIASATGEVLATHITLSRFFAKVMRRANGALLDVLCALVIIASRLRAHLALRQFYRRRT